MGTVYISTDDAFIGKTDERLRVRAQKETLLDVPLIKVDGVVVLGRATVSPAALIELLERKIPLSFMTGTGRFLGRLEPELNKNIFVRSAQWAAAGETPRSVHAVQGFIRGKLKNYRAMLLRAQREGIAGLESGITRLEQAIQPINQTSIIDTLRGLEGAGSAAYFTHFGRLIKMMTSPLQPAVVVPRPTPSMLCSALAMRCCCTTCKEPSTLSALILI
jgi:CRISPR-associated protein Cas1